MTSEIKNAHCRRVTGNGKLCGDTWLLLRVLVALHILRDQYVCRSKCCSCCLFPVFLVPLCLACQGLAFVQNLFVLNCSSLFLKDQS